MCKISFSANDANPLYYAGRLYIGNQEVKDAIISDNVTSIGDYAFYNCSGLTSVTIGNSVTSIGNESFSWCPNLTSVSLPNSVKSIGTNAFQNSTALTSITIPNSVTSVGEYAFKNCSKLAVVSLPEELNIIRRNTFDGCSKLKKIVIPSSVQYIYQEAFKGCTSLESVMVLATTPPFAYDNTFSNYTIPLLVPEASLDLYKTTDPWINFATIQTFTIPSATSISLNKMGIAIKFGAQEQLTATVLPELAEQTVTWTSSDPTVATVDENGLVTAVAVGTTTITATTTDGTNLQATCAVTVTEQGLYIETDLTGLFPTDWQGWNDATGYTPTWAAPMVTTNDGRTVQLCEKYDANKAETGTSLYRVLSGLTNGTYRIELYGVASSTKERDTNIDTDMTAADEGDETAVYLYAKTANGTVKQYIPVHWAISFSEIATTVLNNVIVTDGTVEIGMYSEKKFTNLNAVQIKGVTALVDAVELHVNTLNRAQTALDDDAYVNVTGEERTALQQAIADNTTVTEQTAAAYQAAINALDGATKTFTEAKAGYDGLVASKTMVEAYSYPYATEAKKSAAEGAAAAVATSAADATSKTEALLTAYRQYAESSALMEGIEGAVDVTATYIRNPKAEEAIDANVWQTVLGEGSGGSIGILDGEPWTDGNGDTSHKYFDGGNWGASAWDVTFKQDITLPAGRYQLTAIGRSSQDVALTLIGGEATAEMAHFNATGGLFNRGWEQTSLEFELMQEATVSIGVRGVTNLIHNWMSFSDFRLAQFPASMTAIGEMKAEAEPDAVDNAPIYDLNGRMLNKKPSSGYYILGGKTYFVK